MASICKRKGGSKWLIRYKDEHGRWRTVAGYADKGLTKKLAEQLEFEAKQRQRGWGDSFEESKAIAFNEHLDAFERSMVGCSPDHIDKTIRKIEAFGFESLDELLSPLATDKVNKLLGTKGASTGNHYLTSIQSFCRWLIRNGRIPRTPILTIKKRDVTADDERRAATDDEIRLLLKSVKGESYGLTAEQRYYLYQTALNTGFRAKELSSLLPVDFKSNMVRCRATNTKNKEIANQPIHPAIAKLLQPWIQQHENPTKRVWPGAWYRRAAEMLAVDLAAAKIPVTTAEGTLDFHALRVTYITNLVKAGLFPKAVQKLARHSTMELTMKIYAKLGMDDLERSIGAAKPVSASVRLSTSTVRAKRSKSA